MDSEELDSQRRQERLRRRRQRERDARARETAEQREARLARRMRCSHCHKHIYVQVPACTQGVFTVPPTLCYRKRSTNNVSCSLLRLAPQCPHSLVYIYICMVRPSPAAPLIHNTLCTPAHTQYTVRIPKYSAQYRPQVVMFASSTAQACNIHCHVFKHSSSYVCALVLIVIVEFRNEDI